jgi:hypothetical protein
MPINDLAILDVEVVVSFSFTPPEPPILASRPEDSSPGSPAEVDITDIYLNINRYIVPLSNVLFEHLSSKLNDLIHQQAMWEYEENLSGRLVSLEGRPA